jgi:hypothetical protein
MFQAGAAFLLLVAAKSRAKVLLFKCYASRKDFVGQVCKLALHLVAAGGYARSLLQSFVFVVILRMQNKWDKCQCLIFLRG